MVDRPFGRRTKCIFSILIGQLSGTFFTCLINAVPGNLVLGTHLPRLRQAPFRREKLGEYDSAAVTWILFPFFKEAARRLVSGPPSRSAPSASCCAPALNNSLVFWVSESGYRLRIRKVRKDQAFVDFLDPRGAPIARPYMGGAPSMKMVAHYDDYNEDFRVDLWEQGKGLMLYLDHEYDYVLDSEQREALEPAISRYERDRFLDAYYSLFGPLDHFVRTTEQPRQGT